MIWTVDTWVLVCATQKQEKTEACKGFLDYIAKSHKIALNQEVLREYDKNALLDESKDQSGWAKIWNQGRYELFSSPEDPKAIRLRQRLKTGLPKSIRRFDEDDIPFVVLCFRTKDRHLISGDIGEGDYSCAFTKWLGKGYEICFHDLSEKVPFHVSRHECTMPSEA